MAETVPRLRTPSHPSSARRLPGWPGLAHSSVFLAWCPGPPRPVTVIDSGDVQPLAWSVLPPGPPPPRDREVDSPLACLGVSGTSCLEHVLRRSACRVAPGRGTGRGHCSEGPASTLRERCCAQSLEEILAWTGAV